MGIFNKSVVNQNAYYFNSSNALSDLLQNEEILKNWSAIKEAKNLIEVYIS